MTVEDIQRRINQLCEEGGWSVYKLAKKSGISYSTCYKAICGNTMPKLGTLEKICNGLDITLADFFRKNEESVDVSEEQKFLLERYKRLDKNQRTILAGYMDALDHVYD